MKINNIFAWWNIWVSINSSSFALRCFFNVNGKATMWPTHPLFNMQKWLDFFFLKAWGALQYAYWPHTAGQPPTTTTKNCYKIWHTKYKQFLIPTPFSGVKFRQNVENKKLKGIFYQNILFFSWKNCQILNFLEGNSFAKLILVQ